MFPRLGVLQVNSNRRHHHIDRREAHVQGISSLTPKLNKKGYKWTYKDGSLAVPGYVSDIIQFTRDQDRSRYSRFPVV